MRTKQKLSSEIKQRDKSQIPISELISSTSKASTFLHQRHPKFAFQRGKMRDLTRNRCMETAGIASGSLVLLQIWRACVHQEKVAPVQLLSTEIRQMLIL